MKFFDFCSGIGAGRLGLEQAGMECVGYSEISRNSIKTYNLLHNTENELKFGNLTKINPETLPDFDVAIAGFPCQTFSVIGRQGGLKDVRGQIVFRIMDLLKAKNVPYFIFENVKGLTTHDKGKTLKTIIQSIEQDGYHVEYKVLTSSHFGVPQIRQRVYLIGIRKDLYNSEVELKWPSEDITYTDVKPFLCDINNEISETNLEYFKKYIANETNQGRYKISDLIKEEYLILDTRQSDLRLYRNRIPTLRSFRDGLYYIRDGKIRELTGYEALLIQGFPKEYADKVKSIVDNRHLLMQAGNAMTVGVIKALGETLNQYVKKTNNISGSHSTTEKTSKDSLVGVVKTLKQYNYCLEKNIYYTYLSAIKENLDDIKYVCIYQPRSAFGCENAGIYLYGKVKKTHRVKRSQIHFETEETKKDRNCIVFQVEKWLELERPIKPSSNVKVIAITSFNKIKKAKSYDDLY